MNSRLTTGHRTIAVLLLTVGFLLGALIMPRVADSAPEENVLADLRRHLLPRLQDRHLGRGQGLR